MRRPHVSRTEGPSGLAFAAFMRRHAPLVPLAGGAGIHLHQATNLDAAWLALRRRWPASAGAPPYWAIAWPGARALASHLLDHPAAVRGLRVLEVGCGGALGAIAALRAGAREVTALDIDPLACRAAMANALANEVDLEVRRCDVLEQPADPAWDVVLAGDLWYERFLAQRATTCLHDCAARGMCVLIGDVGRAYLPRGSMKTLQLIEIADSHGTERAGRLHALVAALMPAMRV